MPDELPTLQGDRLTLRPAGPADAARLAEILAEPAVARWWGCNPPEEVREHVGSHPSWAIVVGGEVAGWLHIHEETDPDYPSVAFDIGLTTALQGRGLGREALTVAIRHFAAAGHHRFTVDPSAANERAIRAYAAVGFKPVGILRAYERAPDGSRREGLLMDLLAGELRD